MVMSGYTMDDFRAEMERREVDKQNVPRFESEELRERRRARALGPARLSAQLLSDPSASIKRLAWAFGCARPDSDEEIMLYRALVERILKARSVR